MKEPTLPTDEIFYTGELNEKRITTYKKLADNYRVQEGTVRDIFSQGITFAVSHTAAHTAALREENTRLREALESISTPIHGEYPDIETVNWIAKEALKQ